MSHVVLVAGDLDFAPLVECLVRVGTAMYEPTSAAADLYRAADISTEIKVSRVYDWCSQAFQQTHDLPKPWVGGGLTSQHYILSRTGSVGGKMALLHHTQVHPAHFLLEVKAYDSNNSMFVKSADLNAIERYMKLDHLPVSWP